MFRLSKWFFPTLGLLAFAAACAGGGVYPSAPQALSGALRQSNVASDAAPTCGTPQRLPGKYSVLIAFANIKKGTFVASSRSKWFQYLYAPSTKPTPTPGSSPSPIPSIPPTKPYYIYEGTYKLKKTGHGCAFMFATQSGARFSKIDPFNAIAVTAPALHKAKYVKLTIEQSGPLTLSIHGLEATGGTGTAALLNSGGGTYDTGTVTYLTRIAIP